MMPDERLIEEAKLCNNALWDMWEAISKSKRSVYLKQASQIEGFLNRIIKREEEKDKQ